MIRYTSNAIYVLCNQDGGGVGGGGQMLMVCDMEGGSETPFN